MSEARPLWRQAFDTIEQTVGPPLKTVVNSEPFAIGMGLLSRAQKAAQQRAEQQTRRMLHLWNLPAGSDVTRIIAEIGRLQGQVRDLSRQVKALKEDDGARADGNGRASRPDQTRR
jgi:hypothetical protein